MKIALFIFLCLGFKQILAQNNITELEHQLTNGRARQWTLDSTSLFLGGESCTNGIVIIFSSKNKLAKKSVCVDKKWNDRYFKWKVSQGENDLIPILYFIDSKEKVVETYRVQIFKTIENGQNIEVLKLRNNINTTTPNPRITETIDLFFR